MAVVLVVEDDETVAEVIVLWLERAGHHAVAAADGAVALAVASSVAPELVLTDLSMPVMDGWELIAALARHAALARVPVIAMSAAPEPRPEHALAILRKPFERGELLFAVDEGLRAETSHRLLPGARFGYAR